MSNHNYEDFCYQKALIAKIDMNISNVIVQSDFRITINPLLVKHGLQSRLIT